MKFKLSTLAFIMLSVILWKVEEITGLLTWLLPRQAYYFLWIILVLAFVGLPLLSEKGCKQ